MADSTDIHQDVDLTDDQIQQLLLEAETRLQGPGAVSTTVDDLTALRIPKLSAGSSFEPYVKQGDDVATVEKAKITDPKQKALSNTLHTVGTKKSNKVSLPVTPPLFPPCYEENYPNAKRLMQRNQSVLDCAALVRASFS
jgi:hypothetical protein